MLYFLMLSVIAIGGCKSLLKDINIGDTEKNDRPKIVSPAPQGGGENQTKDLFEFSCNRIVGCDIWSSPVDISWNTALAPLNTVGFEQKFVIKFAEIKDSSNGVGAWYEVFHPETFASVGWYWSFYLIKPSTLAIIPTPNELEYKLINLGENDIQALRWVNKKFSLPEDFIPADLMAIGEDFTFRAGHSLRAPVFDRFKKMAEAASRAHITLKIASSYISFSSQKKIFEDSVAKLGANEAEKVSIHAGHSEHQLGTTLDLSTPELGSEPWNKDFGSSLAFKWLDEHAAEFGFTQSYPLDKEEKSGHVPEPWHFRYVGIAIAKLVKNKSITLEEFFQSEIGEDGYLNIMKSWQSEPVENSPEQPAPVPVSQDSGATGERFTCKAVLGCNIRAAAGGTLDTLGEKLGLLEKGESLKMLGYVILDSGKYRHWVKVEFEAKEAFIWYGDY